VQQSGAADVRILIQNLYKFEVSGSKNLTSEFSDKGWNAKDLKQAFKEVARFRFNDKTNGKRPTSHGAF